MKVIKQYCELMSISPSSPLLHIEQAGRTCYKSEDKITNTSSNKFVRMLIKRGHHSVLEHANATVKFVTDRGVSHELVRHRLAAFSQESTRYCTYNEMTFIKPVWLTDVLLENNLQEKYLNGEVALTDAEGLWLGSMYFAEQMYSLLLKEYNWIAQEARSVLNNSLKTEVVMTANFREWRHVFNLRCDSASHPQMVDLMKMCLNMFSQKVPVVFDDLAEKYLE